MKGLLIKDLKLITAQKRFFIVWFGIAVVLGFTMENCFVTMSYLTILGALFTMSSIGYDEFDNGNAFLFTLPFTKKTYVQSKYLFGFILGFVACALGFILSIGIATIRNSNAFNVEVMGVIGGSLISLVVLLAFMIPFKLKFTAEKAQLAIMAAATIVLVGGMLLIKLLEFLNVDIIALFSSLSTVNIGITVTIVALLMIGFIVVSYQISISILNKKEF